MAASCQSICVFMLRPSFCGRTRNAIGLTRPGAPRPRWATETSACRLVLFNFNGKVAPARPGPGPALNPRVRKADSTGDLFAPAFSFVLDLLSESKQHFTCVGETRFPCLRKACMDSVHQGMQFRCGRIHLSLRCRKTACHDAYWWL